MIFKMEKCVGGYFLMKVGQSAMFLDVELLENTSYIAKRTKKRKKKKKKDSRW